MDKLQQAKEIYQGFTNLLKHKLFLGNEDIEELHNKRYSICKECKDEYGYPNIDAIMDTCSICNCFLPAKTRSESSSCPLGHWDSVD